MSTMSFIRAVAFLSILFVQGVFGLSVSGNKLIDAAGQPILLRGVNKCSFEWNPNGEHASLADYTRMASWGFNIVRLPMNQDFWLSGSSTYNANYKATIQQQVNWIKSLGMYVILDLHWSDQGNLLGKAEQQCMADANSVTFWSQVAAAYKNDPSVLFELYNEPHDVSWSVWLNGGDGCGYTVAGMQQLFNAVRATGANNVVIVGGLNWAYDLSGVASYRVIGDNIAYATHAYNYPGKDADSWDASFGNLAANYPVIATEFGQYCDESSYVATFLAYCQSKGIHWTAWAWYVGGCTFPSVISDWDGTPADIVGFAVKSTLSGISVPPTAVPTVGLYIPATTNQVIYSDSLVNGWTSYGWASDLTYSATAYVFSGRFSISFTPSSYGAVYVHQSTAFDWRMYSSFQFYINGGANSGQSMRVVAYGSNGNTIGNALPLPNAVIAGSWVLENIPISAFAIPQGKLVSGFAIQGVPAIVAMVYVDDITLIAGTASTSSPPVSTTAPTTAPTTVPTTVPSRAPSTAPTTAPTSVPSRAPSAAPTTAPSTAPTTPTTVTTRAPTTAPTRVPTTAPTTAPTPTKPTTPSTVSPTSTPKLPTTAPTAVAPSATIPTSTVGVFSQSTTTTTTTITITMNSGTNNWWVGINSISGSPYAITTVLVKDSSVGAVWKTTTQESWGAWTLAPLSALVPPLSIQLVSAGSQSTTLTNVLTNLNGGSTVSALTTYT